MKQTVRKNAAAARRAPRAVSKARRMGDADTSKRRVEKCDYCRKGTRIRDVKTVSWSSPPPLWLTENPWLLENYSRCRECIEKGVRIEGCAEGGWVHQLHHVAGKDVCLDCGRTEPETDDWSHEWSHEGVGFRSTLGIMLLQATIAARETERRILGELLDGLVAGPIREALVVRMKRLDKDLDERVRRVASLVRWRGR
jgi:hypothetical protein